MARRFVLFSVIVVALSMPAWLGHVTVAAGPKPQPPPAACKDDLVRVKQELAAAREAVKRAEASEAAAPAEVEQHRAAQKARIKRLQSVTGVAVEKLQ